MAKTLPCNIGESTTKKSLLSTALPCDLCRAPSHGKGFAVYIGFFAVQIYARQIAVFP
jgi:hypothetical protein